MADRPPYRAEQVGSLPRPEALMEARAACDVGRLSKDALKEIEDRSIREVVELQERVGIGAITDGEFRRRGWREFVYDRCDGFGPEKVARNFPVRQFDGTVLEPSPEPKITGKLRRREPLAAAEYAALKTMTARPIKANLPTWSFVNFYGGDAAFDHRVYPDRHAAMADAAALLREEIADLGRQGCTYLQFDEVPLALLCDPRNQAVLRERGDDPETAIDFYIAGINAALRGRPSSMAVCVHLCRGNSGHGMADGSYEPIADRLFNRLDVDGFFLEYDTPRAGDFGPLRFLPAPKRAVLGLMSTKLEALEPVDALRRRIDEAAKFVPLDRLCLSPQCGFASVPGRSRSFSLDLVERKLARVVETAHAVWG
jgi:5-methyltetrahydropteroyltriglutamate--homocysteine methyltransferase